MRRVIALFILVVLSLRPLSAQDTVIINLEKRIESITNDSIKVTKLLRGAWDLKYSSPRKAHEFIDRATQLATSIGNVKQVGGSYYYKSIIYYLTAKYDSALLWSDKAKTEYEKLNDAYGIASIFNIRGLIREKIGDYEQAIRNYHESLTQANKTIDLYGQSNPLHNIGLIYNKTGDHKNALDYLLKAMKIREKIGDSVMIAQSYQTVGITYSYIGDTTSSLDYQEKAVEFFRKAEDWYDLAIVYSNLATIYTAKKEFDRSEALLHQAYTLNRRIDNKEGEAQVLVNFAELFNRKKKYAEGEKYARRAINLSDSLNLLSEMELSYDVLTSSLEGQGRFQEGFYAVQKLRVISDSLLNSEKAANIDALEVRYQVREKEQQIAMQQTQLTQQETQLRYTYIFNAAMVLLLLLAVVFVLYLRSQYIRKQEALKQQHELSVREMYLKATLQSQEAERKRVALDLHDGMGQLISSLRLTVAGVQQSADTEERLAIVTKAETILNEMHREIRSIAFNLMPQTLIQYGLVPALKEMALRLNAVSHTTLSVSSLELPDRLKEVQEISVYRIVQEWTNNILKYASASKIDVQLISHDDEITLMVEDNGKGFDPAKLEKSKGHGWRNINSRINLMKGTLDIDSRPERTGTLLIISFPTGKEVESIEVSETEA